MRCFVILLCLIVAASNAGFSDHLPSNKVARGKPESTVAGFDIYRTHLKQVFAVLGKPVKMTETPETSDVVGVKDCEWHRDGLILQVSATTYKGEDSLTSIEVTGTNVHSRFGRTGRGLHLGDTLADVRRIYGSRVLRSNTKDRGILIEIQWEDSSELLLYAKNSKNIDTITLLAPE